MVLVEFSMFPTDKGESVSKYVAQLIGIIDSSNIRYKLTPMGTILKGSWHEVFDVISCCFKTLKPQCNRLTSFIKVDYRKGDQPRMKSKVDKIEQILNRKIQKDQ